MSDRFTLEIPEYLRHQLLAALSGTPAGSPTMTYDEFLEAIDEDTTAEWVNGRMVLSSPASTRHQQLGIFLTRLVAQFVDVHDLGIVLNPPYQMKLADTSREPDLLFLARDHAGRLGDTFLDGPADLVIEITSPESDRRDRADKFYEYRRAAIPEYWIIDSLRQRAEFYQLDTMGRYLPVDPDDAGRYHSRALPGFWVSVSWLWQEILPDPVSALLQIDHEAFSQYLMARLQRSV